MKVISVMAVEGGVGVTTRAIELAANAAEGGQRVLAIDTTQTKQMATLLQQNGFHYLDDVRQLFKPLEQARWQLERMPKFGLLCLPEARQWYRSSERDDEGAMAFCTEIVDSNNAADAHKNLIASLANLAPYFDVLIVDVENKNRALMSQFYKGSDDVHFMRRAQDEADPLAAELAPFLEGRGNTLKVTRIETHWMPLASNAKIDLRFTV